MSSRRQTIILTILTIVIFTGLTLTLSRTSNVNIESVKQNSQVNFCSHLGETRFSSGNYSNLVGHTPTEFVSEAEVVARVRIVDVEQPSFDTPGGNPPTPLAINATDDEEDFYFTGVSAPVVITATNVYSGSEVTGYVVVKWGGIAAACPGFEHIISPNEFDVSVGDEGMIFLDAPGSSLLANPRPWLQRAINLTNQLNSDPNVHYDLMLLDEWYEYQGNNASLAIISQTLPISQLESEVDLATGN